MIPHNKNGTYDGYSFSEENYNAGKCGSGHNLTGDFPQGDARYDAATANMEAPWKIPTKAQGQELINNTTYQWTSMNGVDGGKFTNKSDSTKYIFLPAGGYWDYTTHRNVGASGFYWSTSYDNSSSHAYLVYFNSTMVLVGTNSCYRGLPIRPIK